MKKMHNISEEDTKYIFRSAILENTTIKWSDTLKNNILECQKPFE